MSQMEQTLYLKDAEVNRYLRSKLRALQVQEPEPPPEQPPEKLGKKIAWGPVIKIDPKEIEKQTV